MEIENSRIAPSVATASDKGAPVDRGEKEVRNEADTSSTNAGTTTDTVSLTGQARRLQELETEIAAQPVVDGRRVNEVRNAIENGTFVVDPARIAEKMLSLEQAITDAR
jgi:negative regulator of flagellin synthesis FlgM